MCAVSAIYAYGQQRPLTEWTQPGYDAFKNLLRTAEDFDRIAEQPDCEDPEKAKWMAEVEKRLAALEGK